MTAAMMTGPEHFVAAEKLLDRVDQITVEDETSRMLADTLLQAALVHVQCALVQVTLESHLEQNRYWRRANPPLGDDDRFAGWRELMGLS